MSAWNRKLVKAIPLLHTMFDPFLIIFETILSALGGSFGRPWRRFETPDFQVSVGGAADHVVALFS